MLAEPQVMASVKSGEKGPVFRPAHEQRGAVRGRNKRRGHSGQLDAIFVFRPGRTPAVRYVPDIDNRVYSGIEIKRNKPERVAFVLHLPLPTGCFNAPENSLQQFGLCDQGHGNLTSSVLPAKTAGRAK
jgi:hypothetical protein